MSETIQTYQDIRKYIEDKVKVMPQFLNTAFNIFARMIDEGMDELDNKIAEIEASDEKLVSSFILQIIFPNVLWGSYSLFNLSEMDVLQEKGIFTPQELQAARQWIEARQDET